MYKIIINVYIKVLGQSVEYFVYTAPLYLVNEFIHLGRIGLIFPLNYLYLI